MEMAEKKEALSCFKGGRERVIKEIRQKVKDKFAPVLDDNLELLGRGIGIKIDILKSIRDEPINGQLTLELFQKLKMPLGLSLYEMLGTPDLSGSGVKDYWKKESEHQNSPILFAARCAGLHGDKDTALSLGDRENLALQIYVTLRATEELAEKSW